MSDHDVREINKAFAQLATAGRKQYRTHEALDAYEHETARRNEGAA
jgi:hypothetical protein